MARTLALHFGQLIKCLDLEWDDFFDEELELEDDDDELDDEDDDDNDVVDSFLCLAIVDIFLI